MWPFGDSAIDFEAIDQPIRVDVVATLLSPNVVQSPISALRGAFVHVQVVQQRVYDPQRELLEDKVLGSMVYGDLAELEVESRGKRHRLTLVLRRVGFVFLGDGTTTLVERGLPELMAVYALARVGGALVHHERVFTQGDRFRLRAHVGRESTVGENGYRSAPASRLLVHTDLGVTRLDEVAPTG